MLPVPLALLISLLCYSTCGPFHLLIHNSLYQPRWYSLAMKVPNFPCHPRLTRSGGLICGLDHLIDAAPGWNVFAPRSVIVSDEEIGLPVNSATSKIDAYGP
jgi:hypothetical protein